jgi:hypothetical protein
LNIAFVEAVTLDSGERHEARLAVEPFHPDTDVKEIAAVVDTNLVRVKAALDDAFGKKADGGLPPEQGDAVARDEADKAQSTPLHQQNDELAWMEVGTVREGKVHVEGWREALERQARARPEEAKLYSREMAVIWADTERRMLRYVFPRKGAVSVYVEHTDGPGVMGEIASAVGESDLNILSWLLRRGSAPAYKAEVVFIVEPGDASSKPVDVGQRVREALEGTPAWLRMRSKVLRKPVKPEDGVLYPRRPHEIAVEPTRPMQAMILAVKASLPPDRMPIFISRRFADDVEPDKLAVVEQLRAVLRANGCEPVEALPQPGAEMVASDEVKARMWASKAAILLVMTEPQDDRMREFSVNLAHECGFMQGQGKSLLPLVNKNVAHTIWQYANLQGLQLMEFGDKDMSKIVVAWLERLRGGDDDDDDEDV